jgi:hypothetical protein
LTTPWRADGHDGEESAVATEDEKELQKARADAIRRARDARRRETETDGDRAEDSAAPPADVRPGGPNYVDLIDRKMRKRKERS